MKKFQYERRFCLSELLVVMLILTVLSGLVLPAILQALALARATVCMNNLRQISVCIDFHQEQQGGKIMPSEVIDPGGEESIGSWLNLLYVDHLKENRQVFQCPAHSLSPDQTFNPYGGEGKYGELTQASYLMNTIGGTADDWLQAGLPSPMQTSRGFIGANRNTPFPGAWLKTPSRSIFIADRAPRLDYTSLWSGGNTVSSRGINQFRETDHGIPANRPTTSFRKVNYLHDGGFIALFADHHIEKRMQSEAEEWVAYTR